MAICRTLLGSRGMEPFLLKQLDYPKVIDYIAKQEEHHRVISFQDEYLRFLKTYHMQYDEKYLWD
jgi:putative transposase